MSMWASSGLSDFLPTPKNMMIGELASRCSVMDWRPVQAFLPHAHSSGAVVVSKAVVEEELMNGWVDLSNICLLDAFILCWPTLTRDLSPLAANILCMYVCVKNVN